MDQPQPTKQNNTVNACDIPTIMSIRKAPKRDFAESRGENLGFPIHKQIKPLKMVPVIFNQ